MGQQVSRRVQSVPARSRVRILDVAGLQCSQCVTRASPPRTKADVGKLAESPAKDSQALPAAADFRNSPLAITGIPQGASGAESLG